MGKTEAQGGPWEFHWAWACPDVFHSLARSFFRSIFPMMVLGRSKTNSTFLGYLYGAVTDLTCCCSNLVSWSGSWDRNSGARTTNAFTTSPLVESGLLTTAVSTTAGCSINAFSTSDGPIRYPLELMISSVRPKKWKYPSESLIPRSPRSQKSPRILASVFLGFSKYPEKMPTGRMGFTLMAMSPSLPGGRTFPCSSMI